MPRLPAAERAFRVELMRRANAAIKTVRKQGVNPHDALWFVVYGPGAPRRA